MASPMRYRLADGTPAWGVRWRDPATGQRRFEGLGCVDEATARLTAQEWTQTREGRAVKGAAVDATRALDAFIASRRFLGRSEGSVRFYQGILAPLFEALGPSPSRWTRARFRAYMKAKEGVWGARRFRMATVALRTFRSWATRKCEPRMDVPDVTDGFDVPEVRTEEAACYSAAEAARLLALSRGDRVLRRPVALALLAAFDHGSIRALRWEDIAVGEDGSWTIGGRRPKTGVARSTPVVAELRAALEPRATTGPVCRGVSRAGGDDHLPDERALLRRLHALQKQARVRQGGWHLLRHSSMTLIGAGGNHAATQALGCHVPGSSVTGRYLHADAESKTRALEGVAKALRRASGGKR